MGRRMRSSVDPYTFDSDQTVAVHHAYLRAVEKLSASRKLDAAEKGNLAMIVLRIARQHVRDGGALGSMDDSEKVARDVCARLLSSRAVH